MGNPEVDYMVLDSTIAYATIATCRNLEKNKMNRLEKSQGTWAQGFHDSVCHVM